MIPCTYKTTDWTLASTPWAEKWLTGEVVGGKTVDGERLLLVRNGWGAESWHPEENVRVHP